MKNQIILLFAIFLFGAQIDTFAGNKCDWNAEELNKSLKFQAKLENDLTKGLWIKHTPNTDRTTYFEFESNGQVRIISSTQKDITHQTYAWWVEVLDYEVFLTLKPMTCDMKTHFNVRKHCEGIELFSPADEQTLVLEHAAGTTRQQLKAVSSELLGEWNNATYPFVDTAKKPSKKSLESAFLSLRMHSDGTFEKHFGDHKNKFTEKGTWHLSKNGSFIVFQSQSGASVARLNHLDIDEMVLEFELPATANASYQTPRKDFAFIR